MLAGERNALLRFELGDKCYQQAGHMIWTTTGRLDWGTWKLLRQRAFIQRRSVQFYGVAGRTWVWEISPGGKAAASQLREFGAVRTGE